MIGLINCDYSCREIGGSKGKADGGFSEELSRAVEDNTAVGTDEPLSPSRCDARDEDVTTSSDARDGDITTNADARDEDITTNVDARDEDITTNVDAQDEDITTNSDTHSEALRMLRKKLARQAYFIQLHGDAVMKRRIEAMELREAIILNTSTKRRLLAEMSDNGIRTAVGSSVAGACLDRLLGITNSQLIGTK